MLFVFCISLIAGWAVNLIADAVPRRRALWTVWHWPLCRLPGPLSRPLLRLLNQPHACADCPAPSWRHAAVWSLAPLLGWLAFQQTGWELRSFMVALYAWFFLAIAAIDIEHRLVLNRMLLPALPVMALGSLLFNLPHVTSALLGAALGFGLFFVLAIAWPGAMGMGDVKLAGVIGLVTGIPGIFIALVICIFSGGLAALVVLIHNRFQPGHTIAYAPYLVLGAWIALYFGADLWSLYLGTL